MGTTTRIGTLVILWLSGCGGVGSEASKPVENQTSSEDGETASTGPEKSKFPRVARWVEQLDDPAEIDGATTELERLRCPEAIEPLIRAWRKYDRPPRLLRAVVSLADQPDAKAGGNKDCPNLGDGPYWADAMPMLGEAVAGVDTGDHRSIEDAVFAASALGRTKDPKAVPWLITAVSAKKPKLSPAQQLSVSAVRSLGAFGDDPRAVNTLIKTLRASPNTQPLRLNAAAANALSETGNRKAIAPLLLTLYDIPPIYQQLRRALTGFGSPAARELLDVFAGKHNEVNELAKKLGFSTNCKRAKGPKTACKAPGNLRFKAASLLGDLRYQRAVAALVAQLKKPPEVAFFDKQTGAPGPVDHLAVLDALRKIGDSQVAGPLLAYLKAQSTDDLVRPLAIDVYSWLTRDTAALAHLDKVMKNDLEKDQTRKAAALAYGRLVRKKNQLRPLSYMTKAYARLSEKAARKALRSKKLEDKRYQQKRRDDYRELSLEFQLYKVRALVGIECGDALHCYQRILSIDADAVVDTLHLAGDKLDQHQRAGVRIAAVERALLEIAKAGPKARHLLYDLLRRADSTERVVRAAVLEALVRVAKKPCDKCASRLAEVIGKQKDQTTLHYLTTDTRIVLNYFLAK